MSRRSWLAVTLVIGVGILLQIPDWGGHVEHHADDGRDHRSMAVERVPGVVEAEFSYDEGSGVVTYRTEETDPQVFLAELEDKTGFVARIVEVRTTTPGEEDTRGR